jgi:hypothetical protein
MEKSDIPPPESDNPAKEVVADGQNKDPVVERSIPLRQDEEITVLEHATEQTKPSPGSDDAKQSPLKTTAVSERSPSTRWWRVGIVALFVLVLGLGLCFGFTAFFSDKRD